MLKKFTSNIEKKASMMRHIVLASNSVQRKRVLAALGLSFEIVPANIDEKAIEAGNYLSRAERIARAKAEFVAKKTNGIIIAGDTYDVCEGTILEKPDGLEEAKKMLNLLSGNDAAAYTGFCYIDRENALDFSTAVETTFSFRELSEGEITEYLKTYPVTTWSAAFSPAYPYTHTFVAALKGSLSGFTHGMPIEHLVPLLRLSGVSIRPPAFE